jgi:hypothetical protein
MTNGADAIRRTIQRLNETSSNFTAIVAVMNQFPKWVLQSGNPDAPFVQWFKGNRATDINFMEVNVRRFDGRWEIFSRTNLQSSGTSPEELKQKLSTITEASLAMTPVGSGKIRQVEKPPKAPKASTTSKVDPGESGSKSAKPPKKKTKKSKENYEHIEGDSHTLNFKHGDQDLTGWIEDRGDGTFDVAIVCGKFTVVKGATKETVAKKVKAAAAKLCGSKEIEEGKPDAAGEDMIFDPETEEKIAGKIRDNDDKETDEFVPFWFRKKKVKGKKNKKVKEGWVKGA